MNGITRDTFESMSTDAKLNVLFDYADLNYKQGADIKGRVEALEKRKRFDTACSSGSGLIGGAIAVFLGFIFKVFK